MEKVVDMDPTCQIEQPARFCRCGYELAAHCPDGAPNGCTGLYNDGSPLEWAKARLAMCRAKRDREMDLDPAEIRHLERTASSLEQLVADLS